MLKGNIALVTGGSRGIGRAIALDLALQGAKVALIYAGNETAARETLEAIEAAGGEGALYRCDVTDHQGTGQVVAQILEQWGRIDILVNNAGIVRDGLILNMKPEDFDAVVSTSLTGAFNMIQHCYRSFMKQRGGRIINIASVIALTGNAGQANYASAKAGLIGLTKSVAKELAGRGVTCNAVAPGYIATDMTQALSESVKEKTLGAIPLKRMGQPEDVAALVTFLAGPQAGYITGEVIKVDGGLCI